MVSIVLAIVQLALYVYLGSDIGWPPLWWIIIIIGLLVGLFNKS